MYSKIELFKKSRNRKRKPVYTPLKENIIFQVKMGFLMPGDYLPSENELSKHFNISRPSVRFALEELLAKNLIEKKPGKGTVIKKSRLSSFKTKTGMLEVAFSENNCRDVDSENSFYGIMLKGIETEAKKHHYRILINTIGKINKQFDLYNELKIDKVDGLLVVGTVEKDFLNQLSKSNLPLCLLDYFSPEEELNCVVSANERGTYKATKHLIGLGHRRIAFIGWSPWELNIQLRLEGYKKALRENGIELNQSLIEEARSEKKEKGYQPMMRLLDSGQDFTAVVCANDILIAFPAMKAARKKGLNIPGDISIVGYDNSFFCSYSHPSLTTVSVDKGTMGEEAARRLITLIENPLASAEKIIVETKLIIRSSTAPIVKLGEL